MASQKPSLPKGTRDFSPVEMARRNYIFDTIRGVFRKFGYQEIQTPSMENLETLTGKYGDEGDKLIFKILNSGDYFKPSALSDQLSEINSQNLLPHISEKALRYDLTVPFARYVVMHQNEITFPFKRFQIQPVWRADRPQRGRYREFYQCDADVVGSPSLINEAEFVLIYNEALSKLGLKDFSIKINNRKILSGIAEILEKPDQLIDLTVAIDKLDKIGLEKVLEELGQKGFTEEDHAKLRPFITLGGSNDEKFSHLKTALAASETGLKGIEELEAVFTYIHALSGEKLTAKLELDITLARGLNYYTGAIFEVKTNEVNMGSIGGGGRYDDLTGVFGLKNLTGAGISFGADRIYDVLLELNLFPNDLTQTVKALFCCMDATAEPVAFSLVQKLRGKNVPCELYPAGKNMRKQLDYANARGIPYTVIIGSDEVETGVFTLKNMASGEQEKLSAADLEKALV
ncbi:MAG: histidine--tRNA ligase [Mucilaginibacter polytrichastri]|nr:histidine--tRNA ligase [Mucilaginibacter polytrichastri]